MLHKAIAAHSVSRKLGSEGLLPARWMFCVMTVGCMFFECTKCENCRLLWKTLQSDLTNRKSREARIVVSSSAASRGWDSNREWSRGQGPKLNKPDLRLSGSRNFRDIISSPVQLQGGQNDCQSRKNIKLWGPTRSFWRLQFLGHFPTSVSGLQIPRKPFSKENSKNLFPACASEVAQNDHQSSTR